MYASTSDQVLRKYFLNFLGGLKILNCLVIKDVDQCKEENGRFTNS